MVPLYTLTSTGNFRRLWYLRVEGNRKVMQKVLLGLLGGGSAVVKLEDEKVTPCSKIMKVFL